MSIYLGNIGCVAIERDSLNVPLQGELLEDDVSVDSRRFSFDFPPQALITGDRLEIKRSDGNNLQLVDGTASDFGDWFAHVDHAGGIRLYTTYAEAITGSLDDALLLVQPTEQQLITVQVVGDSYRPVGQIQKYSIATNRELVDLTALGEEFRRQYAGGLISGQGRLSCFWEFQHGLCDIDDGTELANYFAELVIRMKLGASFKGRFYVYLHPLNSIWYESECIATNVSMDFTPAQPVVTAIDFVTTGEFALKMGLPPDKILLEPPPGALEREDGTFILQG